MPSSRCRRGWGDQTAPTWVQKIRQEMTRSTTLPDPEMRLAVYASETKSQPWADSALGTRRSRIPRPGLAEPYVDVRPLHRPLVRGAGRQTQHQVLIQTVDQ